MSDSAHQTALVRRALAYHQPIDTDELLLPRDQAGQLARRMQPAPGTVPRESAALVLFFPQDDALWLPLTVRSSALPQHRGEVSLPGGATDPEDADATATALRETHEELGIDPQTVEVWGQLTSIYIPPSNFQLTPVVGFTAAPPVLVPNPGEITSVFTVPLALLFAAETVVEEDWELHGLPVRVPFFALEGYKVWGATAIVLSELVARMRRVAAAEE